MDQSRSRQHEIGRLGTGVSPEWRLLKSFLREFLRVLSIRFHDHFMTRFSQELGSVPGFRYFLPLALLITRLTRQSGSEIRTIFGETKEDHSIQTLTLY